jgi:NAD(P)-dependent dehydrogenase (short-subunit alcohol dehydrogenase family)
MSLPPLELAGKGIVVTGGGGHLGAAISLALAEAGAVVVVCGRTEEPLRRVTERARRQGTAGRIATVVADIGTDPGLAAALECLTAEAGHLDGWVNNAYSGSGELLGHLTRDGVEATLARGLADVILATQAASNRMRAAGGGSIVNVASMYALVSPQPAAYRLHPQFHNPPAYGAAKAGVVAFTRYAATHLASDGIRVNAVSPGPFPAPEVTDAAPAFADELAARVPLGRIGQPAELGAAIRYLLSDAASFITGHNLVVDGGWTAW